MTFFRYILLALAAVGAATTLNTAESVESTDPVTLNQVSSLSSDKCVPTGAPVCSPTVAPKPTNDMPSGGQPSKNKPRGGPRGPSAPYKKSGNGSGSDSDSDGGSKGKGKGKGHGSGSGSDSDGGGGKGKGHGSGSDGEGGKGRGHGSGSGHGSGGKKGSGHRRGRK